MTITVTVQVTRDVDPDALHAALDALGSASSLRWPSSLPGPLVVTLHAPVTITRRRDLLAAVEAVLPSLPSVRPLQAPLDLVTLRRALAKAARGKVLTPAEVGALDRAESGD